MICATSSPKSGSNWLDRLRSSKGFPTGDDGLDLDRFLAGQTAGPSLEPPVQGHRRNDDVWLDNVTNVLCELFVMGDREGISGNRNKKTARKQANPRFCVVAASTVSENNNCSSDDLRREKSENGLVSSGDNSLNEGKGLKKKEKKKKKNAGLLSKECSRSEVMVIDTSVNEDWRVEAWVFRKESEWEVKEKKIRSRVFKRKKRKSGKLNEKEKNKEKKLKVLNEGHRQPSNDDEGELLKAKVDHHGEVPKKRQEQYAEEFLM